MRIRLFLNFSLVLLSLLATDGFASPSGVEQPPSMRADEMLKKVRAAQSLQPALTYVHWESAYAQLGAPERQLLQVSSPSLLRQRASEVLRNPDLLIRKKIQQQMGLDRLQGIEASVVETLIDSQVPMLRAGIDAEVRKILTYNYIVAGQKVQDAEADVLVRYASPSEKKEVVLHYMKVNGQWWLNPERLQRMNPRGLLQ